MVVKSRSWLDSGSVILSRAAVSSLASPQFSKLSRSAQCPSASVSFLAPVLHGAGTPRFAAFCFPALHGCCFFTSRRQDPPPAKKITAHFISVHALSQWSGTKLTVSPRARLHFILSVVTSHLLAELRRKPQSFQASARVSSVTECLWKEKSSFRYFSHPS